MNTNFTVRNNGEGGQPHRPAAVVTLFVFRSHRKMPHILNSFDSTTTSNIYNRRYPGAIGGYSCPWKLILDNGEFVSVGQVLLLEANIVQSAAVCIVVVTWHVVRDLVR